MIEIIEIVRSRGLKASIVRAPISADCAHVRLYSGPTECLRSPRVRRKHSDAPETLEAASVCGAGGDRTHDPGIMSPLL
jgi:hypothetical protein